MSPKPDKDKDKPEAPTRTKPQKLTFNPLDAEWLQDILPLVALEEWRTFETFLFCARERLLLFEKKDWDKAKEKDKAKLKDPSLLLAFLEDIIRLREHLPPPDPEPDPDPEPEPSPF